VIISEIISFENANIHTLSSNMKLFIHLSLFFKNIYIYLTLNQDFSHRSFKHNYLLYN
jgi:hypothetical protein